ncbi:MAG: hypothetical protein H6707_12350 [Deltaproteobacteria bacterium]|nr:hypothetical protein [Deltaproteobacteria bacterium]
MSNDAGSAIDSAPRGDLRQRDSDVITSDRGKPRIDSNVAIRDGGTVSDSAQAPVDVWIAPDLPPLADGSVGCPGNVAASYRQANAAYLRLSYYTSETEAELLIFSRSSGTADISGAITRSNQPLCAGENRVALPIAALASGQYPLTVTIRSDQTTQVQLTLSKLPPQTSGNTVQIDRYNHSVRLNGQPIFPFGAALYWSKSVASMQGVFNTIVRWDTLYSCANGSISPTEAAQNDWLFDEANRLGLKVIDRLDQSRPWWSYAKPDTSFMATFNDWLAHDVPEILAVTKHNRALLALMGFDEPALNERLDQAKIAVETFKQHDPYHPAFNNYAHGEGVELPQTANEDGISDYIYMTPSGSRARRVASMVDRTVSFAHRQNKFAWIMPLSEENVDGAYAPLTASEQMANTYLMFTGSAAGIYYFIWPAMHRQTYDVIKKLGGEANTLAPALLRRSPSSSTSVTVEPAEVLPAIRTRLTSMPDGTPILLVVNMEDYPIDVSFTLPWVPTDAHLQGMFGRGISDQALSGRAFSERLEALGTRAYRIAGARIVANQIDHPIAIREVHPSGAHHLTEMLQNTSFEGDGFWSTNRPGAVSYDSSRAYLGSRSIRIERANVGDEYVAIKSVKYTLAPNHRYEYGAHVLSNITSYPSGTNWSGVSVLLRASSGSAFEPPIAAAPRKNGVWIDRRQEFRTYDQPIEVHFEILAMDNAGSINVDKVFLRDMGPQPPQSTSKNRLDNSSFEHTRLPGWPVRWHPEGYDPFIRNTFLGDADAPFRLDAQNPYHGKYSLRIEGGSRSQGYVSSVHSRPDRRWGHGIPVTDGKSYTLSFYMRAQSSGTSVTVSANGIAQQSYSLSTNWQRYVLTGVRSGGGVPGYTYLAFDTPTAKSVVWIDAVQFEEGSVATGYVDPPYHANYPDP